MGAIGTKSAVTAATAWTHSFRAASTSAYDQATIGASGIDWSKGSETTGRSSITDSQTLTGSNQVTTLCDHKESAPATSRIKPQKAIIDTAFEKREFSI
jgi:hypothetical protein